MVGTSRKSFIGKITGREAGERIGGTVASNVLALAAGADAFRVHDVREVREALMVAEAIARAGASGALTSASPDGLRSRQLPDGPVDRAR